MQFKSPTYQLTNSLSTSFALCGEAEVDNVAVADDVVFAFEPDLTVIAARGHRAARDQTVVADHFRANEPPRDVAVNLAGGGLCRRVARNRPRAALVFADREERNIPEELVAGADDAVEARFLQVQIGQKRGGG